MSQLDQNIRMYQFDIHSQNFQNESDERMWQFCQIISDYTVGSEICCRE